jgi:hypothetical protein
MSDRLYFVHGENANHDGVSTPAGSRAMSKQRPIMASTVPQPFELSSSLALPGQSLERWTLSRHAGATVALAHAVQIFGFFLSDRRVSHVHQQSLR